MLEALIARRIGLWDPDHLAEREAVSRELIALGRGMGDRERELQGHHWLVVNLLEGGDVRRRRGRDRRSRGAGRRPLPAGLPLVRADLAGPARARSAATRPPGPGWPPAAPTLGRAAGDGNADMSEYMNAITARVIAGRMADEDVAALERFVATSPVSIAFRSMLAWVLAERGEAAAARAHLAIVAPDRFAACRATSTGCRRCTRAPRPRCCSATRP